MGRAENLAAWRRRVPALRRSDVAERGKAGKLIRAEWKGVKQLEDEVEGLLEHLEGKREQSGIRSIDREVVGPAAEIIRDSIASRTISQRWPRAVSDAAFAFTDLSKVQGKKRQALVGIPTGAPQGKRPSIRTRENPRGLYVEWGKRSGAKRGMSLARIFESGTKKFAARPVMQQAVHQAGPAALKAMGDGYRAVLADLRARYTFADF
jgi:hypothetical protein